MIREFINGFLNRIKNHMKEKQCTDLTELDINDISKYPEDVKFFSKIIQT